MITLLRYALLVAIVAAGAGVWLSRPQPLAPEVMADLTGDAAAGERVYLAAGCRSCHAAPEGEDKNLLTGGERFASDFGTFVAPNISIDPVHGIGNWTQAEFANAVMRGVSPEGRHYYPAFPYTAYINMNPQDVADLWAFWQTLPASDVPSQPQDVPFPFSIRRAVGLWKTLYLSPGWVVADVPDAQVADGRYLVEALAHCGECHTPRGPLGAMDTARWLAGAPNPSGQGTIPPLTPGAFDWSATDIAYYLQTGFTPDYDSAGGHMVAVIENFAELSAEDRAAVAAYLKALPR